MIVTGATPFRAIGPCPRQVWHDVAASVSSPISSDDLNAMYDAAKGYSALCLALLVKESTVGRDISAQRTKNPLGLMHLDGSTLMTFSSWAASVVEWYRRVSDPTYKGGVYPQGCSLAQFCYTYVGGPGCWTSQGKTCANGETAASATLYLDQTVVRVNTYIGSGGSVDNGNPFTTPVQHHLSTDYAKYGLTKAQATKVMSHRFVDRGGKKPLGIVLHIQQGTTRGSLSWWASGNADASASVIVSKNGTVLTVIDSQHGPWTNGDVSKPNARGQAFIAKANGANVNNISLTIETEGQSGETLPDVEIDAICWQIREWQKQFGLTDQDIYRHADLNSTSRAFCPGPYYDVVLKRLADSGTPVDPAPPKPTDEWQGRPSWLPAKAIKDLFPEADPSGLRTRAWLAYCAKVGRAPARDRFLFRGTADELIVFSDGMMLDVRGHVVSEGS